MSRPGRTLIYCGYNPAEGYAEFRCEDTGERFAMRPADLAALVRLHIPKSVFPTPPCALAKRVERVHPHQAPARIAASSAPIRFSPSR